MAGGLAGLACLRCVLLTTVVGCDRVPEECPQDVSDLIDACLLTDPAMRPTALSALDVLMREPDEEPAPPPAA